MDSPGFTIFHVVISVFAIISGFAAWVGIVRSKLQPTLTVVFLLTAAATSLTGFFFPRDQVLPSHIVGAIALVVLGLTAAARYAFGLRGRWRMVFAAGVVASLWFNVFVLVVQAFLKVSFLHGLAPKGSEPPFAIAQILVLVLFIVFGVRAVRRFDPMLAPRAITRSAPGTVVPPSTG